MMSDASVAAAQPDFLAGLVTEMDGASVPLGPNAVNFSVRQPYGVVARILAFNHPFMFCVGKMAAPRGGHRTAMAVEAGIVWLNGVAKHFLGVPFGGVKQSGIGREDAPEELVAFTQEKNTHISLVGQ